jgi:anti-sigma factor RsiW
MECPANEREKAAVLMDYFARKLDPNSSLAMERHLEHCAACQEWMRRQQMVWSALDGWEAAAVSPDFDRQLYQRIAREERPPFWSGLFRPAFSLALASLVLLAALLIRPLPPQAAGPPQQAHVESLDVDRLEKALDDVEMLRQLNLAPSTEPQSM